MVFRKICRSVVLLLSFLLMVNAGAISRADVPEMYLYEGQLHDRDGNALSTPHVFRFSFWKSADYIETDQSEGSIDETSENYGGWQEVQTATPNSSGIFSIKLGNVTALPEINYANHKFLQVEIKRQGEPDTSFQLLDPTGDAGVDTEDRKTIASVPYASHAQTSEESVSGKFTIEQSPDAEYPDEVRLEFGKTLEKFLSYDTTNGYFHFNDDVQIDGNLNVTGLINGFDFSNLATAPENSHLQNTDTGTNSSTFTINTEGNNLILNSTGLSASRTITFPDADTKLVGEDSPQTLTNKNIDGTLNTLTNIPISALETREKSFFLIPEYLQMTVVEDGTDNLATLKQGVDSVENHRYYVLSSQENTLQDLELKIAISVPNDFLGWQGIPFQIFLKSTSGDALENQLDIEMSDTEMGSVILSDNEDLVTTGIWEENGITWSGTPQFSPGEVFILTLRLQARNGHSVSVGEIRLNYLGK